MACKSKWSFAAAFFMAFGSVYSGPAMAAEEATPANEAAEASAAEPVEASAAEQGVEVSRFDTVSLNVQNTDLSQVLQLLSIQGRRNIVPSPQVQGTVTANLYDVTFQEALDAILQQNGAGYIQKGDFIYVYTLEELDRIRQSERKLAYEVVKLNYITAEDASTFVTPLLSKAGSIAISGDVGPGFQPSVGDGGANSFAHTDTMVIRDYAENMEEIKKVIKKLDTRPMQVLVEATILKADITEDLEFGVDFSILTDLAVDSAGLVNPLSGFDDLISGDIDTDQASVITSGVGNTATQAANGGLNVGVVTNNVSAFVHALDSVTDTTLIANPKILALNRQRAEVLIGQKLGYLSTTSTATATTQTVEFLDVGTQLTLRPFVSNDGFIRLELKPQVSTGSVTTTANFTVPNEETQELTTNVMVRDGQTIVLGGLFKEETTIERDQVPFLGDIPIAGAAFKGKDDKFTREEYVFLITPHIVKDESLYAAGEAMLDSVEITRIGAREGLLPWSRTKLTAGHLRDALRALEGNDREKALYEVDLALGLDPTQPEAIRLKEKLTGQRVYWPDRSLLNEAVNMMVEQKTGKPVNIRSTPMSPDPAPMKPKVPELKLPEPATSDAEAEPTSEEPEAEPTSGPVEPVAVSPAGPSASEEAETVSSVTADSAADESSEADDASNAEAEPVEAATAVRTDESPATAIDAPNADQVSAEAALTIEDDMLIEGFTGEAEDRSTADQAADAALEREPSVEPGLAAGGEPTDDSLPSVLLEAIQSYYGDPMSDEPTATTKVDPILEDGGY